MPIRTGYKNLQLQTQPARKNVLGMRRLLTPFSLCELAYESDVHLNLRKKPAPEGGKACYCKIGNEKQAREQGTRVVVVM